MDFKTFRRNVDKLKISAELKGFEADDLKVIITRSRGDIIVGLHDNFDIICHVRIKGE